LTAEERKNGWTAETLDAYLRGSLEAYSYRYEILTRCREAERIASARVEAFKKEHDLADSREKRDLERIEIELANISAMTNRALDLLENV
jgi:hypothetical protein